MARGGDPLSWLLEAPIYSYHQGLDVDHNNLEDAGGGGGRACRSLEDLPTDIREHILSCQCDCDHLGYGNFSVSNLPVILLIHSFVLKVLYAIYRIEIDCLCINHV